MHEMAIALEIVAQLEPLADEHDLERIESVTVRAGLLRGVVPEALEMAFASAAEGTAAEGATLQLEVAPAKARCRGCGTNFQPTVQNFLCPQCKQADVEILSGNEVLLVGVEGTGKEHSD
jgi:hydrogenase nickel incorporation protein HypA/HybF